MSPGAPPPIDHESGAPRVVAALFVTAIFSWGLAFYGLGFYLSELPDRGEWSLGLLSSLTFVFYAASTLLGFAIGLAMQRTNGRPVFVIGSLALAGAVVLMGHVTSTWQLVIAYLVLAIGWACLSMNPISSTVLAWYGDRGATPLTIALTGASAGGIVMIPALVWLSGAVGFTASLTIVGIVELVVIGALALFVIRTPDTISSRHTRAAIAWSSLRRQRFWMLSGGLALAIVVQVGFLVHQLTLLTESISSGAAATVVSLTTASALAGRLVFIVATRYTDAIWPGCGLVAVQIGALLTLRFVQPSLPSLVVIGIAFGLGVGVLITLPPLLTRSSLPEEPFDSTFPLVNAVYATGVALGAPVLMLLRKATGSYDDAAVALAAIDAVALVLLILSRAGQNRWD